MPPKGKELRPNVTRRGFLKGSAAVAASLAAAHSLAAGDSSTSGTPDPKSEPLLFLPPLLSCPTETSIRINALNNKRPAEAVLEVRKEGTADWQRWETPLKLEAHEVLNWTLKELSPATRYEYRILAKDGESSF